MNLKDKYYYDFGGWLKKNAGTIGSVAGTIGGSFIGMPQLGGAVGGAIGGAVQQADATKTAEEEQKKQQNIAAAKNMGNTLIQQANPIQQLPTTTLNPNVINKNGGILNNNDMRRYDDGGKIKYNNYLASIGAPQRKELTDEDRGFYKDTPKNFKPTNLDEEQPISIQELGRLQEQSKPSKSGRTVADEFKDITGESWGKSVGSWRDAYSKLNGRKLSTNASDNLELLKWIKDSKGGGRAEANAQYNAPEVNSEEDVNNEQLEQSNLEDTARPDSPDMYSQGDPVSVRNPSQQSPMGYEAQGKTYRRNPEGGLDIRSRRGDFVPEGSIRGALNSFGRGFDEEYEGQLEKEGKPVYKADGGKLHWTQKASRARKIGDLMKMSTGQEDADFLNNMSDDELHKFHKYCNGGKMR